MKIIKKTDTISFSESRRSIYGFTLAELIVVIAILAILSTIAFSSVQTYLSQARDSKRITNVDIISEGFNFALAAGKPIITAETATSPNIVLSGSALTMTGYYGNIGTRLLVSLGVSGNDLTTHDGFQSYQYSYYPTGNKYQVMALLENNNSLSYDGGLFNQTYAATTQSGGYVYIKGNFTATGGIVGLLPKTISWETISGTPKVLDGATEVLKTGDISDMDPLSGLPTGNVSGYAYSEAFGWIDFSYVSINNTTFSGTIWSEGVGWIDFNPNAPNTLTLAWGSGVRKFDGKVWSEGIGWIHFNPDATNQVYIASDGTWKGRAWSESAGWIDFNSGSVH